MIALLSARSPAALELRRNRFGYYRRSAILSRPIQGLVPRRGWSGYMYLGVLSLASAVDGLPEHTARHQCTESLEQV